MVDLNREFLVKQYEKDELINKTFINISNNHIRKIDSNTFIGLTNLETLSLHHNEIEKIDFRLFESLSNLKWLFLSNNKLKRIDSNTFQGLTNLNILSLHHNEIEQIDVKSFESLSNLKALRLDNNKVKEIDRKCFERLKSISVIEIYENEGLNALSFIKPLTRFIYDKEKVEKYGSISEWEKFLQQFPQIAKIPSSWSISDLSAINREIDNKIQDQYIGLLLSDRYEVIKKLGKGAFGLLVYLVDDTKTNIKRAKRKTMKIINQMNDSTVNKIELFSEISHENIVRYSDHFHMSIGDENKTFLITEYCQRGNLGIKIKHAKRSDRNFEERQILDWISQSTNALNYLHSRKPEPIIHQDIKPENMFLSRKNEIKLGDLGISKLMVNIHAGTRQYMSPEVFKAQVMDIKYYPNTDIWSLGCVLYELKFLTFAFPRGQFGDPPIPSKVSSSGIFSSVLPKMMEKYCLKRITSDKLFTELLNLY